MHTPTSGQKNHSDTLFRIALLSLALLLSGCAGFRANMADLDSRESAKQYENVDIHSAYPTISRENIEQINLLELIDPQQQAKAAYPTLWKEAEKRNGMRDTQQYGPRYDLTLSWFRQSSMSPEEKRLTRNGVQERMLSASMSRCNVFKTFLRRNQSDVSFYLGSATTVSGILGAVLPGVRASRNLAGAAGIFSGLEAEYNQSYFSNLTAEVLIKGIELRQATVQEQLRRVGQKQSISDYPMESALRDAIYFDGLCSTVVGLEQAAESISHEENPGLKQGLRTITSIKALNEISSATSLSELQSSGKLEKLQAQIAQSTPLAATPATETAAPDISEQFFLMEPGLLNYLHAHASMLRDSYQQKYDALLEQDSPPDSERNSIAVPDDILRAFETKVKTDLIDGLQLDQCGTGIPGLLLGLANARNKLREVTSKSNIVRFQESRDLDNALFEISKKRHFLDQVINAAKQDIDTAAEKAREKWQAVSKFAELPEADKLSVTVTPLASRLPACANQEANAINSETPQQAKSNGSKQQKGKPQKN